MVGAPDFEVEGGDGTVGGGDVGIEVSFGHIFWEGFAPFCELYERLRSRLGNHQKFTMGGQDGCKYGLGFLKGESRAGYEGLQESTVAVIVLAVSIVGHFVSLRTAKSRQS